jgi:hypothetical protein
VTVRPAANGSVWYHREHPDSEPPPQGPVVQLIIKHRLAVSLSSRPDLSDRADGSGVSRPRQR